jgi:hypothetical protein
MIGKAPDVEGLRWSFDQVVEGDEAVNERLGNARPGAASVSIVEASFGLEWDGN